MSRQKPQHLRTAKANSECCCARACFLTRSLEASNFFRLLYKCCVNFAKFLRTQFFWNSNSWPLLLNCINVDLAIISKICTNTGIQGEGVSSLMCMYALTLSLSWFWHHVCLMVSCIICINLCLYHLYKFNVIFIHLRYFFLQNQFLLPWKKLTKNALNFS